MKEMCLCVFVCVCVCVWCEPYFLAKTVEILTPQCRISSCTICFIDACTKKNSWRYGTFQVLELMQCSAMSKFTAYSYHYVDMNSIV